jgi:hypothetical protein
MDEALAERLLADLVAARDAAEALAGRPSAGVRAVEPSVGHRWYLCAFVGPAFLCLTAQLEPERDERRVRRVAVASLLYEQAEMLVDAEALRELARAAGRLLASGPEPGEVADAAGAVADEALGLAAWRDAPERALASLPDVEWAGVRHERVRAAYTRFVTATEPLVTMQDELSADLVARLRGLEEAAGRAGVAEDLTARLGAAVPACDNGADEILAAHLTALGAA